MADRIRLFSTFGVPWEAERRAWLYPVAYITAGVAVSIGLGLVSQDVTDPATVVLRGVLFGLIMIASYALHSVGHVLSANACGAPMTRNLVTAVRQVNHYTDAEPVTSRQHLLRSLGGPVANLLMMGVGLLLWAVVGGPYVIFLTAVNALLGVGALAPIPGVDGGVIWRELARH
ncbi:MAG: hypothetical protein ACFB51_22020 [Anaerolineae bacterium]